MAIEFAGHDSVSMLGVVCKVLCGFFSAECVHVAALIAGAIDFYHDVYDAGVVAFQGSCLSPSCLWTQVAHLGWVPWGRNMFFESKRVVCWYSSGMVLGVKEIEHPLSC